MSNLDEQINIVEATKSAIIDMAEEIRAHMILHHADGEEQQDLINDYAANLIESIKTLRPDTRTAGNRWAGE